MVALALDIGQVRIGIAVSDRSGRVALPVKVLPAIEVTSMARSFRQIVEDHEPDIIVCGRPQTMAGEDGPQAERVISVGRQIADALDLPLVFADERLSSREAKRILRENGLSERKMRGKVDMVAASLILQAWLDAQNGKDDCA
ncbi:Holliday junction resolvase RuvX [Collinsella tanakaei]|uniref:Putative pre-16S rRNA nuclease n=1 Tax=Collinsella ihumii TaxID=1720204 RepID=A0A921IQL3_9ACTN|nr:MULTISPECIES: Holliday junction resolvase RuvX [Collinsella]MBM6688819.1 Holliday junction resolvase RuvX [Collinsella tanakaei]MBM6775864.1 Holliday junction resolvase RuvX [Collinsella tanakaei]MBM6784962.1 Holliday junction resolvase RuvX [Collinsella tanakaei]MDN0054876.1 Holliday junction resolvase RuvX [Collinsella ihumii]MDN0064048.1 Holliday junction resolvase RuvX [Collinsella ihumii]